MRRLRHLGVALLLAVGGAPPATADVVTDWNTQLLDSIRAERTNPPRATRIIAMVNTAVYDAVNGIVGGYQPYHVFAEGPAGASAEAAAAAAAHAILSAAFPGRQATFDAALAASLAAIPDGAAKSDGMAWGEHCAAEITTLRADDGAGGTVTYEVPEGANWWVATPPAFAAPLLPQWPYVTPWAMTRGSQFRAPAPPPLSSAEYAAAYEEVRRMGNAGSPFRTPGQSQIAQFWDDGPGTTTPPGHWQLIAQIVAAERGNTLAENARLFALLGIAVADAAISSWDSKYHWNHWRPYTGIALADTDGNPATQVQEGWSSFINTPPFPTYTSGHSTFSGASSRILALFFDTDEVAFSTPSDSLPGVVRSFDSFSEAGEEAGQSRIYGGIHWQYDNQEALKAGRALAEHAFFNFLRPMVASGPCVADGDTLCLNGGRFRVEAKWAAPQGTRGAGRAVTETDEAGLFWFFNDDNIELTVKLLDGCDPFGHYWVFASGTTDVEVTLTVTDTLAGVERTYFNRIGKPFAPIQDTSAFATCP
jgi:hypothetical protein